MDAEDTRIAQERIDHAETRLATLRGQGLDTSGLSSQLTFARGALREGRTLDVLAICEEVLLSAKRLETGSGPRIRTDRMPRPQATPTPATGGQAAPSALTPQATETVYPSGHYASPTTEALDRHRLTEEIRQVVQADLMPKALSSAQLHDRINKSVAKAFTDQLASFRSEIDERFQRLAATPETKDFVRHEPVAPAAPAVDVPALMGEFEQRLDARTAGIARSTAQAINDAISGIDQRLHQLADPERLRQQIGGAVDDAVRNGLATLELQRQESAARNAVSDSEAQARDRATLERLATAVDQLDQTVATQVATAMAGATEAIAGPIRELVGEVLAKSGPPNLEALTQKLAKELRADLDWQVERLAAERGWVSIADVQAEVARTGGNGGPAAPAPTHTFARLEAALVEFVHQSQVQQQQFLGVLQQRVEQSAENVTRSLAKALADENHRSSAMFRAPQHHSGDDERHAALESLADRPNPDLDLDVLSQTAQHRAISSLTVPPPQGTAMFLPGTLAVRKTPAPMATPDQDGTRQTLRVPAAEPLVDESAPTVPNLNGPGELGTEVVEMAPVTGPIVNSAAAEVRDDLATTILPPLATESFAEAEPDEAKPASGSIPREAGTDRQAALDPATPQAGNASGSHGAIAPVTGHVSRASGVISAAPEASTGSITATQAAVNPTSELDTETIVPGTARAMATDEPLNPSSGAYPAEPLTGSAARPAPTGSDSRAAKTTTTRVGALEAGLRTLVRSEIERQLTGGLRDTLRQALGLDQPAVTPAVLAAHVEEALTKAMAERGQLSGATLAPTEADDRNRSALTMPWAPGPHGREDLVRLLREPGVRQEILGIVAVEVLANPGALAELSGIRAFIRNEVGNAARELAESSLAKGSTLHGDPALA